MTRLSESGLALATAIIPARYGSTRLPGKALADIGGRPMIARVLDRVRQARRVGQVLVATDDERIAAAVAAAGGEAVLTAAHHRSGTDRIAQVVEERGTTGIIVNVQGDEPLIEPAVIDALVDAMATTGAAVGTVSAPLVGDPADPARVKVVLAADGRALYFSRAPVPWGGPYRLHVGIYAFQADSLRRFPTLPVGPLETAERLEQLRFLESGLSITVIAADAAGRSVDTPEDLVYVRKLLNS